MNPKHFKQLFCTLASTLFFLLTGCSEPHQTSPSTDIEPGPCVPGVVCDWRAQPEEDVLAAREATVWLETSVSPEQANAPVKSQTYRELITRVEARLLEIPGIEHVNHTGKLLTYTTAHGYKHRAHLGADHGRPLPARLATTLARAPADLHERVEAMLENERSMRAQALVTKASPELPREKKRALLLAPWAWSFEAIDEEDDLLEIKDALSQKRDYASMGENRVTAHARVDPWPGIDEDVNGGLSLFHGWERNNFLYISTHGGSKDMLLNTGIIIGTRHYTQRDSSKPPQDLFEDTPLQGLDCQGFYSNYKQRGLGCSAHTQVEIEGVEGHFTLYTLVVDRFYLEQVGSTLDNARSIAILFSCSSLKHFEGDPGKQGFFGDQSIVIGGDDVLASSHPIPRDLSLRLIRGNWESNALYATYPKDNYGHVDTERFPGVIRHFPSDRGLRVAEAVTLYPRTFGLDPGTHLEDGDILPVRLDEAGKPRVLEVDVELNGFRNLEITKTIHGTDYNIPGFTSSDWALDIEETDGLSQDSRSMGSLLGGAKTFDHFKTVSDATGPGFPFPLARLDFSSIKLKFDRDIDTEDPIFLRATLTLPEGGESIHTVRVVPKPLESAWTLLGTGQTSEREVGYFVTAQHQEPLSRLAVYLRDDQEAFTSMSSSVEVDLTIRGFDGTPGTFQGAGSVAMKVYFRDLNISCTDASATVNLTSFVSDKELAGTFVSGDNVVCKQGDSPLSISFSGTFIFEDSDD